MFMSCFMVINGSCSTNMCARQLSFSFSSMVWGPPLWIRPWTMVVMKMVLIGGCLVEYTRMTWLGLCIGVTYSTVEVCFTWTSPAQRRTFTSTSRAWRQCQKSVAASSRTARVASWCRKLHTTRWHRPVLRSLITSCSRNNRRAEREPTSASSAH